MRTLRIHLQQVVNDADGQDLLEYAMLAALIAVVAVGSVGAVGSVITNTFWNTIAAASF